MESSGKSIRFLITSLWIQIESLRVHPLIWAANQRVLPWMHGQTMYLIWISHRFLFGKSECPQVVEVSTKTRRRTRGRRRRIPDWNCFVSMVSPAPELASCQAGLLAGWRTWWAAWLAGWLATWLGRLAPHRRDFNQRVLPLIWPQNQRVLPLIGGAKKLILHCIYCYFIDFHDFPGSACSGVVPGV